MLLFLVTAVSQSIGLRYVVADLLQPERYGTDHVSERVRALAPAYERIPQDADIYLVRSYEGEPVLDIWMMLAAVQHVFAPRIVQGSIWRPARPFEIATRAEVEDRGITLQELYRIPGGGLVMCACEP